jgi:hypothetical protein
VVAVLPRLQAREGRGHRSRGAVGGIHARVVVHALQRAVGELLLVEPEAVPGVGVHRVVGKGVQGSPLRVDVLRDARGGRQPQRALGQGVPDAHAVHACGDVALDRVVGVGYPEAAYPVRLVLEERLPLGGLPEPGHQVVLMTLSCSMPSSMK